MAALNNMKLRTNKRPMEEAEKQRGNNRLLSIKLDDWRLV